MRMKSPLLLAALASLLAAGSASAASKGPAPARLETVQAGNYKVDPKHTQVVFSVLHFGFTDYTGIFSKASGTMTLDPARLSDAKLDISIAIDSVLTTSSKLTEELAGDQWFDAAKYPAATFVSTHVTKSGKGALTIAGDLTLHGVTKPVVLTGHFIGAGVSPITKAYTAGFEATTMIKRSDFGVITYLPGIGDDVKLTIAGAFEKQE